MAARSLTQEEIEKLVQEKPNDWRFVDHEGAVVGRIKVGRYCGRKSGNTLWECECSCGVRYVTSSSVLNNPRTKSCGCYLNEIRGKATITHGATQSSEYEIWCGIKRRCLNPDDDAYPDYGGRGVTVCEEWRDSFQKFLEDVGLRPSPEHSIDRFPNNNGNYEPGNIRWATRKEQANNRRSSRLITAQGETKTLMQWGESSGLGWATIKGRLDLGWTPERAVSEPARKGTLPVGVSRSKKRFRARIRVNGKWLGLGSFDTPEEASQVYKEADAARKSAKNDGTASTDAKNRQAEEAAV